MPSEASLVLNNGVRMPRLIYGTAWKKAQTEPLVATALDIGFGGIDTAGQPKHYDEAGVGRALAAHFARGVRRESLYVQTKFTPVDGHDPARIPYDRNAPLALQVEQSAASSLRNLQLDVIDGYILHSPLPTPNETLTAWRAMERIHAGGAVRALGISNCYHLRVLEQLVAQAHVKPAIVQNRFHAETQYDTALRAFCREHGIVYQSFWTLTANPHVLGSEVVRQIAREHGRTAAQIFFRFLVQEEIVPLTGTTSVQHMREDLAVFEFKLNAAECAAVQSLLL